jgi:hypothetical protein
MDLDLKILWAKNTLWVVRERTTLTAVRTAKNNY